MEPRAPAVMAPCRGQRWPGRFASMSRWTLTSAPTLGLPLLLRARHWCRSWACRHRRCPRAAQRHCAARPQRHLPPAAQGSGSGHFAAGSPSGATSCSSSRSASAVRARADPTQTLGKGAHRATAASRPTTRPSGAMPAPASGAWGTATAGRRHPPRHRRALGGRARPARRRRE